MKETRMPPALSANLVANSGNTIYGVSVIPELKLVELKMELELKILELELKTGIVFFLSNCYCSTY